MLQEKYGKFFNIDLSRVVLGKDSSYIIKDMIGVQGNALCVNLLSRGCFHWKVGNGELIRFWEDAWHRDGPLMDLFPRLYNITRLQFCPMKFFFSLWEEKGVSDNSLWVRPISSRDEGFLSSLLSILQEINLNDSRDMLGWKPSKGGIFSAKEFVKLSSSSIQIGNSRSHIWEIIWKIKVPPKINIFLWKLQWGILPTYAFLHRIMPDSPLVCKWCNLEIEDIKHLFWDCCLAKWAWDFIGNWWSIKNKLSSIGFFSLNTLFNLKKKILGIFGHL